MATTSGADHLRAHGADDASLRLLFNDIFRSYEQPLFRLAANLCKDDSMARDIIHDVFLKLWEIRQQLHEIESIEAFLFTMTRNRIMDYLRKVASDARLKQTLWESMQHAATTQTNTAEEKEYHEVLTVPSTGSRPSEKRSICCAMPGIITKKSPTSSKFPDTPSKTR